MFFGIAIAIVFVFSLITQGIQERFGWVLFSFLLLYSFKIKKTSLKPLSMGILVGYFMSLCILPFFSYTIDKPYIAKNYLNSKNTAVILVFFEESYSFNISLELKNQLEQMRFWKYPIIPFRLFNTKLLYEKNTVNSKIHNQILQSNLAAVLDNNYKVYSSYMYQKPYLREVLYRSIMEGNGRIIVVPVTLTESNKMKEIHNTVAQINPQEYGIKIKKTNPLWDSHDVAISCVNWLYAHIPDNRRLNTGILLIGEDHNSRKVSNHQLKQEVLFKEKIKDLLINNGYNSRLIRHSHLQDKAIKKEIEAFMQQGVKDVLIVQMMELNESLTNTVRLNRIIGKIDTHPHINIQLIKGWQHHSNGVLNELEKRIRVLSMEKWD